MSKNDRDHAHGPLDHTDPEDVERVRVKLAELRAARPRTLDSQTVLAIVIVLVALYFVQPQGSATTAETLVAFVLALLLHDAGHMLALRAYGHSELLPSKFPGFGAVTSRAPGPVGATEVVVVALMGPLPGLLLAFAGTFWMPFSTSLPASALAAVLLVNGANLLPLAPLDGYRILWVTLSTSSRGLWLATSALASVALIGIAWWMHAWIFAAAGVVALISVPSLQLNAEVADDLRESWHLADPTEGTVPATVPDAVLPDAIRVLNEREFGQHRRKRAPEAYASMIVKAWQQVALPRASTAAIVICAVSYCACILLLAATIYRLRGA